MTSVELRTSISLQIVQGEPPNVIITDQKWDPPLLTLFFKNNGGSGTITLRFTIAGSNQYDTVHLNARASSTYTRIFATLGRITGPPDVQIISQQADLGMQTRTTQIPYKVVIGEKTSTIVVTYGRPAYGLSGDSLLRFLYRDSHWQTGFCLVGTDLYRDGVCSRRS